MLITTEHFHVYFATLQNASSVLLVISDRGSWHLMSLAALDRSLARSLYYTLSRRSVLRDVTKQFCNLIGLQDSCRGRPVLGSEDLVSGMSRQATPSIASQGE